MRRTLTALVCILPLFAQDKQAPPRQPATIAQASPKTVTQRGPLSIAFDPNNWSNWVAALATVLAAVAAMIAAGIAVRTLRAIEEQARIAGGALEAARAQVELEREALKQAVASNRITQAATELTRQSFLRSNRPKVIARDFSLNLGSLTPGTTANGKFSIVNVGGTIAHIDGARATVIVKKVLPMKIECEAVAGFMQETALRPGESIEGKFQKDDVALTAFELVNITTFSKAITSSSLEAVLNFWVVGVIKYFDELDPPTLRRTYFCRHCNPHTQRFQAVDDSDYENAD